MYFNLWLVPLRRVCFHPLYWQDQLWAVSLGWRVPALHFSSHDPWLSSQSVNWLSPPVSMPLARGISGLHPALSVFTSAEWRRRISSLSLLAILSLTQTRWLLTACATRAHCWLIIKLFIPSFAESLQSCFEAGWPPACAGGWDYSFLDTGLLLSPLHDLSVGSFVQSVVVALKWQHNHLVYQPLLPLRYTQAHVPGN